MNTARLIGAMAGGLVAGLAITALLIKGEQDRGEPSELADLERTTADRLGGETPPADSLPDAREQAVIQSGHLALSLAAGAAYAAATDEDTPVVASGIGFGLAFYAAAHWLAGPILGLKQPEWKTGSKGIAMHTANHIGFGLITALGAK
ncbi:MAG: hypothetical protein MK010_12185, partial [Erythrobacter sp.]|nr:hypothetical protein [Erythrobacter sp.]